MKLKDFIKRLFKRSDQLDDELHKKLSFISRRLEDRAKLNATIDPKKRTGRLYDSITTKRKKEAGVTFNLF